MENIVDLETLHEDVLGEDKEDEKENKMEEEKKILSQLHRTLKKKKF